jgi:hypothetical protein
MAVRMYWERYVSLDGKRYGEWERVVRTCAGREGVDSDSMLADFLRHGSAELVDGGFACVVGAAGQALLCWVGMDILSSAWVGEFWIARSYPVGDAARHGRNEDDASLDLVRHHVVCNRFGCDEGSCGE